MTKPIIPAVDVFHVSHSYKGRNALDHVSFQITPGSLHGFVGPNGAGKTTTLKIICTLLRPQSGRAEVFGLNVVNQVQGVRKKIGFMPDHFSMYRAMSVAEYLDFFAAAYGQNLSQRTRVVDEVLALTDMSGRRDDLIQGLSRGMQQRVGLARVLVNDPELLLLDEPASGLDPRARIELMDILKALKSMGKTIFISSHILSELAELCDSVTIIDRGKVKYTGSMSGLLVRQGEHPTYKLTIGNEFQEEQLSQIGQIPGVVEVIAGEEANVARISFDLTVLSINDLLGNVITMNLPITAFTEDRRHLNEAFMDLTERGVR